jgi:hypothetical protein
LSCLANEDNVVNIANQQRERFNISGTYVIEPDFEEFKKFIDLSQRVINGESKIQVSFEETPSTVKLIY